MQSRYYDPVTCRFLSADVLLSTGQGLLGYNMFAYCLNNPIMYADYSGNVPLGIIPLWDFWKIHKEVQERVVDEYGYAMEVYVKKDDGKRGFLDLFDAETNQYYEVKHVLTASSSHTSDQMLAYDTATVKDWRFLFYTFEESPSRGTNNAISGTFNYGIYTISYRVQEPGLITYSLVKNSAAIATAAAIIVAGLSGVAMGFVAPRNSGMATPVCKTP